jgi:hypothetical protein
MRWAGHVARMGEKRKVYKVLVGRPEGKRPLGRPRRRWEDGIRMDLREIGLGCVDWIRLAQVRDRWRAVVNAVIIFSSKIQDLAKTEQDIFREVSLSKKHANTVPLKKKQKYRKAKEIEYIQHEQNGLRIQIKKFLMITVITKACPEPNFSKPQSKPYAFIYLFIYLQFI